MAIVDIAIILGYVLTIIVGILVMLYLSYLMIEIIPRLLLSIPIIFRFVERVKQASYHKSNTTKDKDYSVINTNYVPYRCNEIFNIFNCFNYWFGTPRKSNKTNSQNNSGGDKGTLDSSPDIIKQDSPRVLHKHIVSKDKGSNN